MADDVQLAIYSATVVLNLALAVAVGGTMAGLWLVSGTSAWSSAQVRRVRPVRICAASAAIAALGSLLPLVSASMAEVPIAEAGEAMGAMLADSHFGLAWKVGMGALLVAALAAVVPVSGQRLRHVALANLLALAVALYAQHGEPRGGGRGPERGHVRRLDALMSDQRMDGRSFHRRFYNADRARSRRRDRACRS